MTSRRSVGTLLGVFWLLALGLLVLAVVLFDDTRLSHRTGFPYMPLYGALTWWFFLVIPLIGATWGFFNDWKRD